MGEERKPKRRLLEAEGSLSRQDNDFHDLDVWKQENAAALLESNDWVERNGLPLEKLRLF